MKRTEKTILDISERLRVVLASSPSEVDLEDPDLLVCTKRVRTARLFAKYAVSVDWYRFLHKRQRLVRLFSNDVRLSEADIVIVDWICNRFIVDHAEIVLEAYHEYAQTLNPRFWRVIVWQLTHGDPMPEPDILGKWLSILLNHVPADAKLSNSLDYLLSKMRYPDDLDSALVLLNYLLSPMTETDNVDYKPRVTLRGDDYWLKESWKNYFLPHLDKVDYSRRVIAMTEANLIAAHQLARSTGNADENDDPASRWRSAIEPHSQDDTGGKLDPLINIARDTLEHALTNTPGEGKATVERWIVHKAPLLRRIAIHGVGVSTSYTSNQKLQWLLDKELIFKYKHEVFQVLKASFASASTELQNKIISLGEKGPSLSEDIENRHEISKYESYNLLFWLHKNAPESQQAKKAFETAQSENPNFKTREFADFDMWIGGAELVREVSPRKPEELRQMSPDATIELFSSLPEETFSDERSKRGMAEAIGAAVTQSFDWSSRLVDAAIKCEIKDNYFWYNISHAWLSMDLSDGNWRWILMMLKDNISIHGVSTEIPNLIESGAKDKKISTELLPVAEEASDAIWESLKDKTLNYEHDQDWLMTAMNEPIGRVVEAWIQLLGRHVMDKPEDWKGMSDEYKKRFKTAIEHEGIAGKLARATIMSRFHWFFSVDMDWARTVLLPYFDFDRNQQHAEQSWHGFLYWGRIYPAVRPLMKKYLAQAVEHLPNTQRDIRDQLFHHVVDILLGDAGNPLKDGWFYDILKSKSITAENRREMARRIWHTLRDADDTFKYSIWDRWLNKYWKDRTDNIPIKLTNEEATEFLNWAPVMSENFPEAVDRICEFKSFPIKYTFLFSDLKDDKLDERFPEDLLRMLVHVLNDGNNTTLHCHDLVPLYETLKEKLGDEQTLKLKALLMEKGCIS